MATTDTQKRRSKYLDPEILSQIGPLEVVAKQVVEGLRIGVHRSPLRGISTEFTSHRQYAPGDEARHIDWKVYGRTHRYYVKLFEAYSSFEIFPEAYCIDELASSNRFATKLVSASNSFT